MAREFFSRLFSLTSLAWLGIYGALWALLSGGHGFAFGIVWIVIATLLSLWLRLRLWRLRLQYLPGFIVFFLRALFSGGWDVARRAFHPRLSLQTAWVTYPLALGDGRFRLALSATVGLLPGTLATEIRGDHMQVHVLDERLQWQPTFIELEQQLARLLGVDG